MRDIAEQPSEGPLKTFQIESLPVRVYGDHSSLATSVASEVAQYLREVIAAQGEAFVMLATGNSQIQFLELLTQSRLVEWSKVRFCHMDEYLGISGDHSASFRRFLRERVEQKVQPGSFEYLEGDVLEPLTECDRYANLLRERPVDLCCLGIGENGHLAFNDPPVAHFDDRYSVKLVKLDQDCQQQQVNEGHFPSLEAVPDYAFTVTIPTLCAAKKMFCLAPDERKAAAVKQALYGPVSTDCPASHLRSQPHATLLLDQASAASL